MIVLSCLHSPTEQHPLTGNSFPFHGAFSDLREMDALPQSQAMCGCPEENCRENNAQIRTEHSSGKQNRANKIAPFYWHFFRPISYLTPEYLL
jgi:hypothetical protein